MTIKQIEAELDAIADARGYLLDDAENRARLREMAKRERELTKARDQILSNIGRAA